MRLNSFSDTLRVASDPLEPESRRVEALERLSNEIWGKYARSSNPKIAQALRLCAAGLRWKRFRQHRHAAILQAAAAGREPQFVRLRARWQTGDDRRKAEIIPERDLSPDDYQSWFIAEARRQLEETACQLVYGKSTAETRRTPWKYLPDFFAPRQPRRRVYPIGQRFNTGGREVDPNSRTQQEREADRDEWLIRMAVMRGDLPEWMYPRFPTPLEALLIAETRRRTFAEIIAPLSRQQAQVVRLVLAAVADNPNAKKSAIYRRVARELNISNEHLRVQVRRIRKKKLPIRTLLTECQKMALVCRGGHEREKESTAIIDRCSASAWRGRHAGTCPGDQRSADRPGACA